MTLLRRILASLIDLSVLVVSILILFHILNYFKIELEQKYFLLLAFSTSYFIPILILKNTFGRIFLKTHVNSPTKLALKYLIYYVIFSGLVGQYFGFITELTHFNYKPAQFEVHLIYFVSAFFIINILFFLFSLGKYNLVDFVLNLSFSNIGYKRYKHLFLLSWLSILLLTIIFEISGETSYFSQYVTRFFNSNLGYNYTNYFPKEKFDEYSYFQIEKIENSNMVISFSNKESLFKGCFLTQKTIYSFINKSTFENVNKRLEYCQLINIYSEINGIFNDTNNMIDQTKFVLMYIKPETYFSHKTYTFCYYFDNKDSKFSYYGGINTDSLKVSYSKDLNRKQEILQKSLAKALGITIESLVKRYKRYSEIKLTKQQKRLYLNEYNKEILKNDLFVVTIIPFAKVEPIKIRSFNVKHNIQEIESTSNQYWDDNLYKALVWRDYYIQQEI